MAQQSVRLVLEAEDKTRAILDQFGRTVVDLGQKTEASMLRVETSMQRGARATRQLVVPLVSELVPALDNTVGRMASVVSGAALLGTGLTAVGIAGAGLAGVLIGQLVSSLREAAKAKEEFNRAMTSGDLGKIQDAIRKTADEAARLARELNKTATPRPESGFFEGGGAQSFFTAKDQAAATAAAETLTQQKLALDAFRQTRGAVEAELEGMRDFPVVVAELSRKWLEEDERARDQFVKGHAEAAQAIIDEHFAMTQALAKIAEERFKEEARQLEEHRRGQVAAAQAIIDQDFDEAQTIARFDTEKAQRQELLALERARLDALKQIGPIVTQEDAAQARLLEISLTRQRESVIAINDTERALIDLRAEYDRHIVLMDELRRTDPTVGMISGVKILAEEWASLGRVMESLTLNIGQNVAQTLGRAMRGETKNIAQDFANALMRTITDSIAQYVTGNLFRGLLPGGAGIPLGSVGAPLNVTGAPSGALVGLQQSGYQLVAGTGGQTYAVPSAGLAYPAALPALSRTRQRVQELNPEMMPGDPAFAGVVVGPDIDESVNFAAEYGSNAPSRADVGGSNYLAGAFSVAALGLSAYSTYDTARTQGARAGAGAAGIATTGFTGAAAGAALGIGAGLGAAGGLVLAFVAIALGGAAAERKRAQRGRRADRQLAASHTLEDLASGINNLNAAGIDEGLSLRLRSGNTLGGLLMALALEMGHSELARFLDLRGVQAEAFRFRATAFRGEGEVGSLGELLAYAGADNVRELLDSALQALLGVQATDEGALFGFQEYDPRSRVSRTTYRPFTQLDTIAPSTQNLFASTAQFRRAGLDDLAIERQWRRVMANSTRRDIRFDLDEPSFDGVDL